MAGVEIVMRVIRLFPLLLLLPVLGFAQEDATKIRTLADYPNEGMVYWRAGEVREGPHYYHYNQGSEGWTCFVDSDGHHVDCSKDDAGGIAVLGSGLELSPTLVISGEHGHPYTPNVLFGLINGGDQTPTKIKIAGNKNVNAWKFHYRMLPDEQLGSDLIVKLFCTPIFGKDGKITDEACYQTLSPARKYIKIN